MSLLLTVLSVIALASLLIAVPTVVVLRDLRAGHPDPAYREPDR